MKKTVTYGQIKEGKLHIFKRKELDEIIKHTDNCYVVITFEKKRKKRSLPQNAYYWGVLINEFVEGYKETTGDKITSEQAHDILKLKCNYKEITNERTGEIMQVPRSTTEMTTFQFMEYLEECIKFIYEWFNRQVPLPNEQGELWK